MLPNIKKSTSSLNSNLLGTRPTTSLNKLNSDKNLVDKVKSNNLVIKTNSTNVQELQEYLNILLTKYMELKSVKRQVLEIESNIVDFHIRSKKAKTSKKEVQMKSENVSSSFQLLAKSYQIFKEEFFFINKKNNNNLSTSDSDSTSTSKNTNKEKVSVNQETVNKLNKIDFLLNNKEIISKINTSEKNIQTDLPLENEYFKNHCKVLENEISSLKFNLNEKNSLISKLNVSSVKQMNEISEELIIFKEENKNLLNKLDFINKENSQLIDNIENLKKNEKNNLDSLKALNEKLKFVENEFSQYKIQYSNIKDKENKCDNCENLKLIIKENEKNSNIDKNTINDLQSLINDNNKLIQNQKNELNLQLKSFKEIKNKNEEINNNCIAHLSELEKLRNASKENCKDCVNLGFEIDKLKKNSMTLKEEIQKLKNTNEILQKSSMELEKNSNISKNLIDSLKQDNKILNENIKELKNEILKLNIEKDSVNKISRIDKNLVEELRIRCEEINSKLIDNENYFKNEIDILNNRILKIVNSSNEVRKKLSNDHLRNKEYQNKLEIQIIENKKIQVEFENQKSKYKALNSNQLKHVKKLESDLETLKKEIFELNDKLNQYIIENNGKSKVIDERNAEINNLKLYISDDILKKLYSI